MAEAFAIGIAPDKFIDMTYRELHACFRGAALRNKREAKRGFEIAWYGARFYRAKKMPNLRNFLRAIDPPPPMHGAEMRNAIVSAFTALGANVIRRKKSEP